MALTGSLGFTWGNPTNLEGLLVQSESEVKLGKERMYGSLETTSTSYTSYGASIGLKADSFWKLGLLNSLSFEHVPSYEQVESANVRQSGIWIVSEEEMTISVGMYEFNFDVFDIAFGTGYKYTFDNDTEAVITLGDGDQVRSRPLEIATQNVYNSGITTTDYKTRIRGIVVTVYDAICTSGVPFGDLNAGALNTVDLEFSARAVLANDAGNRFASIYVV